MAKPTKPTKPARGKNIPVAPSPFRDALSGMKEQFVQAAEAQRKAEAQARLKPPPPPAVVEPERSPLTDEELLALALAGVRPLSGPGRVAPLPPPPQRPVLPGAEKPKGLLGLTSAEEPDEPDWWSGDIDPSFLWALSGERPWQRTLDLHGKDVAAAERDLEAAIHASRQQKHACILVIHGKGLRSEGQPRLGGAVRVQLRGKLKRLVLGYSTARLEHGGTGAIYVWIRPLV